MCSCCDHLPGGFKGTNLKVLERVASLKTEVLLMRNSRRSQYPYSGGLRSRTLLRPCISKHKLRKALDRFPSNYCRAMWNVSGEMSHNAADLQEGFRLLSPGMFKATRSIPT